MTTLQDAIAQRDYWRDLLNRPQPTHSQDIHAWLVARLQEAEKRVTDLEMRRGSFADELLGSGINLLAANPETAKDALIIWLAERLVEAHSALAQIASATAAYERRTSAHRQTRSIR